MEIAARLLDVLLALVLLVFLGEGWRNGLGRSIGGILGVVAGGVAAFLLVPVWSALLPDPVWRIAITAAASVLLLVGGHALGTGVARGLSRRRVDPDDPDRVDLPVLSRLLGALVDGVVTVLVVALIAGAVGPLGVPIVSRAIAGSVVLRAIDAITPAPVDAALSRVRSAILEEGLPAISEALGGVQVSPGAPDLDTSTPQLAAAAQSVVRIGGTAYACGQNQTGSGFVVADDRVVTNAHVVAGVERPVVHAPNGQTIEGAVVYYDPIDDLAVIAAPGLDAAPLPLSDPLPVGAEGVVDGYPYGGPFTSGGAEVLAVSTERIEDVYGSSSSPREVYSLAATIAPGNSGGPFLTLEGEVAGVVFARNATDPQLGYAMTGQELAPVAAAAAGFDDPVSSGACVSG